MGELISTGRRIFWDDDRGGPRAWAVAFLWPASQIYRGVILGRARFARAADRLPAPVVSVGNLVVGGTGKTPAVLWIARHLMSLGRKPAILSRGYGGGAGRGPLVVSDGEAVLADAARAGDEPAMLAQRGGGAVVVAGSDRRLCGLHAVERLGADCFILDDGYQHTKLHRDLNLLLLDSSRPFGNGRLLPAGTLREPRSAAARADLIVFTRWDQRDGGEKDRRSVAEAVGDRRILKASHGYVGLASACPVGAAGENGKPLASAPADALLVSGIAAPGRFEDTVRRAGHSVCGHLSFGDHHRYSDADVETIGRRAREVGANAVLTTEKDAVRLPPSAAHLGVPVYCVRIELRIDEGLAKLHEALGGLFD